MAVAEAVAAVTSEVAIAAAEVHPAVFNNTRRGDYAYSLYPWFVLCSAGGGFVGVLSSFAQCNSGQSPSVILTGLLALGGWLLYYLWVEYFTSRDEDAGMAVALIVLYIFFKPRQYLFVVTQHKKVLHRMLDMSEQSRN